MSTNPWGDFGPDLDAEATSHAAKFGRPEVPEAAARRREDKAAGVLMSDGLVDVPGPSAEAWPGGHVVESLVEGVGELSEGVDSGALVRVARARFRVLTYDDLLELPEPDPVVEGLLPARQALAMIAGARGLGKTMLGTDIAGHIASDLPLWNGLEVRHHGPVLYIAREGFPSLPERARAWHIAKGRRPDEVYWMPDPVDLKRPGDAELVAALARDLGAVAVFVDSARATGAGKEDTGDMGAYVAGLETLRDASGALVTVLHNTGWDGTRERGSTLLPDACDTVLLVEGDPDGARSLKHRKHRDGAMLDEPLWFEFRPVESTRSGVLVPATKPASGLTLRELVTLQVARTPGLGSGAIAAALGRPRPKVSTTLQGLQADGLVRNVGKSNRAEWVPP